MTRGTTGPRLHGIAGAAESKVSAAAESAVPAHTSENCNLCNAGPELPFSMAFQPIVNVAERTVWAYEALARGPEGEPAATVLNHSLHNNRYAIDQRCREKAVAVASALGILQTSAALSINFYPNAVYEPRQCLARTFAAANAVGFPLNRLIFEITEVEEVRDHEHLRRIMTEYRTHGLRLAIDDFGAGHSGLNLLSVFQPDIIKVDRVLVDHIDQRSASRSIVRSIVRMCAEMDVTLVAEGIEREEEMQVLCEMGISLMQGFLFARQAFEGLPRWPS